jgi:phospholipase/carboxylesterase
MHQSELPTNAGPVEWVGPDHPLYNLTGLFHCVRLPPQAGPQNPVPAVVMLHGWGGNEAAMWVFKQAAGADVAIITPRAPVELSAGGFVWFDYCGGGRIHPEVELWRQTMGRLRAFLNALPDVYPINPARLALVGFSQGAAIAISLALAGFYRPAGLASLAGFVPSIPGLVDQAKPLPGLPVFVAHGNRDETVPVAQARRARASFAGLGAAVTYTEYAAGHKVHTAGMKALKKWLAGVLYPA